MHLLLFHRNDKPIRIRAKNGMEMEMGMGMEMEMGMGMGMGMGGGYGDGDEDGDGDGNGDGNPYEIHSCAIIYPPSPRHWHPLQNSIQRCGYRAVLYDLSSAAVEYARIQL